MKTSTALSARLQRFLAQIHPPSPPTAQENRQLLNVIQSSFKRQLDARHPNPSLSAQNDHNIPTHRDSISAHATTTHVRGLLSHPVFGHPDHHPGRDDDAASLFDRLVAGSKVDVSKLPGLLTWYNRSSARAHTISDEDTFGMKLHAWLFSANTSTQSEFFLNKAALRPALKLLDGESNETVLWKWLAAVYQRDSLSTTLQSTQWLDIEDNLVSVLIRIAVRRHLMDEAAQQYVQACQYKFDSGRATTLESSFLTASCRRLAATIIFLRHRHNISPDLFSTVSKFLVPWSVVPEASWAFCGIYSPTAPTADQLYSHLRNEPNVLLERQKHASRISRKAVLTALLDASKLSLAQGKRKQAVFLLDFATEHYPDYLPAKQKEDVEPQLELSFNLLSRLQPT